MEATLPQNQEDRSIKTSVRRGAWASALGQIGSQIVSIGSLAILMHLLSATPYGLLNMVLPFIFFLRIFTTLGLNAAAVQRQQLTTLERSQLFWWTLLLGIVCTIVAAASAPLLARFYARPEIKQTLVQLTYALSGMLLLTALGAQHLAYLERNLQFATLARIRLLAQIVGAALGIAAAWRNAVVWALVVQQYAELFLLTLLAWAKAGWLPRLPSRGIHASESISEGKDFKIKHGPDKNKAPSMFRFGLLFALASAVLFGTEYIDRVLVAWQAGAEAAGFYAQAKNLMIKPVYLITMPLSALALASLSKTASEPATRQLLAVGFYRILAITLLPVSIGLSLVATDVMRLMGGTPWMAAGRLLSILALGLFAQAVLIFNGWVLVAAGKTGQLLVASLVVLLILAQAYGFCGWMLPNGMEFSQGIAVTFSITLTLVLLIPHTWFCSQSLGISISKIAHTMKRPIIAALLMGISVWGLREALNKLTVEHAAWPIARLAMCIAVGAAVYLAAAWKEIAWLRNQWAAMRNTDG